MANPNFYPSATSLHADDLAGLSAVQVIQGELTHPIRNATEIDDIFAPSGSIGFIKERKYLSLLQNTSLDAVIVPAEMLESVPEGCCAVVSHHPRISFAALLAKLYPYVFDTVPEDDTSDLIHPTAEISEGVKMGRGVIVGAHAKIARGTQIGDYSVIDHHVEIGECSRIGRLNTIRYALIGDGFWCDDHNTLGCAGFAFEPAADRFQPVAQVGLLNIGEGVHITSGNGIDRGALGDTVIGNHVQIESLCKIGHNVQIGDWTCIVGHCAIAGSAVIGKGVKIAGKVGVKGFVSIGDKATILAFSAVTNNVAAGATMFGVPARKFKEFGARELVVSKMLKKSH